MGQVLQAGAGQAPARQAAIGAGLPMEVGATRSTRSARPRIRAVEIADSMIRAGDHDVIVAGGMESMSNAPYAARQARFGYKLGDGTLDRLDGARRPDLDLRRAAHGGAGIVRVAVSSASRARTRTPGRCARTSGRSAAIDEGRFAEEIVPVGDVDTDEGAATRHVAREARGAEARLRRRRHDDCRQRARRERRRRRARRRRARSSRGSAASRCWRRSSSQGYVADEFAYLARTPAKAGAIALQKAGKTIDDVERVELNEAFSSVVAQLGADARRR